MKKQLVIQYEEFENHLGLSDVELKMLDKAKLSAENAYSPYSNFKVGASVLLENGTVLVGNNQENIAFPSGICAERVVLFNAGANFSTEPIQSILIVSKGNLLPNEQVISPCGACRQVMLESEKRQGTPIKVILTSQSGRLIVFSSVSELLPLSFG
jgi:cytidine deaminase